MNVFGTVKTSINTREAAVRYGVEVNRHGKALCPFHNDRHPSLFVDDDHYYCYACGEYGDVIDFTSKLHGLSLYDAAKKLAYDFGITQDKPPTKEMQEKLNKKSEAQRLKENEKLCFLRSWSITSFCRSGWYCVRQEHRRTKWTADLPKPVIGCPMWSIWWIC